jgi:REP element-mobilizing transposase RayT
MPNHIHLVVTIVGGDCRDVPWRVSTEGKDKIMQEISNRQGKLSTTIGGMKQAITRFARHHNLPFAWQPRFHDHIIRGNKDMNKIADYIENNVARWEYDRFYG